MQAGKSGKVQSAINVTPLVDVVLVLLIIFMVIAPQMSTDSSIQLPKTEQPPKKPDDTAQITVVMERNGQIWIDRDAVTADRFPEVIQLVANKDADSKVVIKGDARLTFGEVKQAMLAVEAAGFKDVGLIAESREEAEANRMGN